MAKDASVEKWRKNGKEWYQILGGKAWCRILIINYWAIKRRWVSYVCLCLYFYKENICGDGDS